MSEPWAARLIGRILLRATALEDLDDDHAAAAAGRGIGEMVLGEPGNRITELVSEPGLLGDLGKNLCCRLSGSRDPIRLKMPNSIAHSFVLPLR